MRKCNKCGEDKPLTGEFFHCRSKKLGTFINQCRQCKADYDKEYRKQNRDALRATCKRWRTNYTDKHGVCHTTSSRHKNDEYRVSRNERIKSRKRGLLPYANIGLSTELKINFPGCDIDHVVEQAWLNKHFNEFGLWMSELKRNKIPLTKEYHKFKTAKTAENRHNINVSLFKVFFPDWKLLWAEYYNQHVGRAA